MPQILLVFTLASVGWLSVYAFNLVMSRESALYRVFYIDTADGQTARARAMIRYHGDAWCAGVFFEEGVRKVGKRLSMQTLMERFAKDADGLRREFNREVGLFLSSTRCKGTLIQNGAYELHLDSWIPAAARKRPLP